jgi:glutamate/tyrosine decarboxylase-like PLP-dependent enzyme
MVWSPKRSDTPADPGDFARAVLEPIIERLRLTPPPLGHPRHVDDLHAALGTTITPDGLGGTEALRRFTEILAPTCLAIDHPLYLAYVPVAPTVAATVAEFLVSAWNVYGGTWADGAGAIHAENEALRWLCDIAGLPTEAGGTFVSGGTAGNLSALLVARHRWRARAEGAFDRTRGIVLASGGAHSSVEAAVRVMDVDVIAVPTDEHGRLTRDGLVATLRGLGAVQRSRVMAVVATSGTTNAGVVDDLEAAADGAADLGAWFHIDGAYGAAALLSPTCRPRFAGFERCDSFIVDPHKWLFAPFDCCALLYRDPAEARITHTQQAEYLDVCQIRGEWNPSDFAHHLTRRARGLPFWFGLATYGTDAIAAAVEYTVQLARTAARLVDEAAHLELVMKPELSVVLVRRPGWDADAYQAWTDRILADGLGYVTPTGWNGETITRFCFVNPTTTVDDVRRLIASME